MLPFLTLKLNSTKTIIDDEVENLGGGIYDGVLGAFSSKSSKSNLVRGVKSPITSLE